MSSPDRITKLIPRPRPVTLGGASYPVWEFTLNDLAELQGWLDDEWEDPLEAIEERLLTEEIPAAERDRMLFAAHSVAEVGPPIDGSPEAAAKFSTPEGICAFIAFALRKGSPKLTWADIATIYVRMTPGEYAKLRRVTSGTSSLRTLTRLILGYDPPGEGSWTWGQAIDELARSHGWTYETIYGMTVTEFVNARGEGTPIDESVRKIAPGEDLVASAARQQARYEGKAVDG